MWLNEEENLILKYVELCGEVGTSAREICRKAATKDRWKENERWAYPHISTLKDKKLIITNPAGHYRLPPTKEEEEEEKRLRGGG